MRLASALLVPAAMVGFSLATMATPAEPPAEGVPPPAAGGVPSIAKQVNELSALPRVVPLSVRNLIPRGNALGCDLQAVDFGDLLLRALCNEFADISQPQSGFAASLMTAADMAYTYDGIYICGLVDNELADRTVFGQPARIRLSIYFPELMTTTDGGLLLQKRDSSINLTRRGLDFTFAAHELRSAEVDAESAGSRRCVTLRFAQGTQSGDQPRLPNDVWVPTSQVSLFMALPPLLPWSFTPPLQSGNIFSVSEIGLTVAGRRPVEP
jgi:hypothetical protein